MGIYCIIDSGLPPRQPRRGRTRAALAEPSTLARRLDLLLDLGATRAACLAILLRRPGEHLRVRRLQRELGGERSVHAVRCAMSALKGAMAAHFLSGAILHRYARGWALAPGAAALINGRLAAAFDERPMPS